MQSFMLFLVILSIQYIKVEVTQQYFKPQGFHKELAEIPNH